jgi:hypothetical protein
MRLLCMTFALLATAALAQDEPAQLSPPAAADVTAVGAPATGGPEPANATQPANQQETANAGDESAVEPAGATDDEPAAALAANGPRTMSGMSILGNEETPTSLVIVPWKSSRLGDGVGVSNALDDSPRALDRDVFTRELRYYELRAGDGE